MTRTTLTTADRIWHALRATSVTLDDAVVHVGCTKTDLSEGQLTSGQLGKLATFVGFPVEWFRGDLPMMDDEIMLLGAVVTAGPENLRLRGRAVPYGPDQARGRA